MIEKFDDDDLCMISDHILHYNHFLVIFGILYL